MEVRDPVHGSIQILDEQVPILKHGFFQRLRGIKQLGFSEYAFPGATHTRYIHSIGVMKVSSLAFQKIFKNSSTEMKRLEETLKLACLLHDIGHAPLSHSTESVMPTVDKLNLPSGFLEGDHQNRQATHEDYTIKMITDSSFTDSLKLLEQKFGVDKNCVADLILGKTQRPDYFLHAGVNYFPLLHQLVSSEMDCDRMDYLLRDSYFCGVPYGKFDLDWILDNISPTIVDQHAYLGISERAVSTFDDFLLSRFHMFLMVYFHYRAVCLEKMLIKYFESDDQSYTIPSDIEEYADHDDHLLLKALKKSKNIWAKRILDNNIPKKILETFGPEQKGKIEKLEAFLQDRGIEYISCSSKGRLSKYYTDKKIEPNSIKVIRSGFETLPGNNEILPIGEATDLFSKYSQVHEVNRIHCDIEELEEKDLKEIHSIAKNF